METPRRKKIRLDGWDYSKAGWYFITFCTIDKSCILWPQEPQPPVGAALGRPALSPVGILVEEELHRIPIAYPMISLERYVIMPNHVHIILAIAQGGSRDGRPRAAPTISQIINQTKGRISKRAGFSVWQKSFYDHILRDEDEYLRTVQYIDENPVKWEDDRYNVKNVKI
ncbi:MAG: hypothetical protein LIO95_05435 [Clostridiales bacterium]|nr:hypothetical protein [Clostridiales bacterium]